MKNRHLISSEGISFDTTIIHPKGGYGKYQKVVAPFSNRFHIPGRVEK